MYKLLEKLFPICRSITGEGVRETFRIIKDIIPISVKEVPSGTKVFDWVVPNEWNIKDAYVKDEKGTRIIDYNKSNLHVVNYSIPFEGKLTLNELKNHLEQLRAIDHGINIDVIYTKNKSVGIDTVKDYVEIKKIMEYKI